MYQVRADVSACPLNVPDLYMHEGKQRSIYESGLHPLQMTGQATNSSTIIENH